MGFVAVARRRALVDSRAMCLRAAPRRPRLAPLVLVLASVLVTARCAGALPPADPPGDTPAHAAGSGGVNRAEHAGKPYVLLVSLDGFRADYLDRFDLPNLRRVAARGARAGAMIPVFPSLTFPNHYSLVTGLHPGRHGIVSNVFFDPERKRTYAMHDAATVTDGSWYRGEPVWVTAERQGMVAACYFWPGSEAAIGGVRPTISERYDGAVPNDARVKGVLEWLQRPAERRPHLVTLYFSDVDTASHRGPLGSHAVEEAARAVDRAVGALVAGIEALPIRDQVYLVLTSDHGMVETTPAQAVRLESLIDPAEIETAFGGPVGNIHLRGGSRRAAFVRNRVNSQLTHGRAYLRQEVPERHVYRDPRVGDVVVIMDEGWLLATPSSRDRYPTGPWGMHGWDPALTSMHATFVVAGPGIRRGATIGTVANIDVYPFMAELLGLRPAAGIDGRPGEIGKRVTRGEDGTARSSSSQWPVNRGSPGNWLEPPRSTWALADRQN